MGAIVLDLLPILVSAALVPAWIILVLILLTEQQGVWKATGFVAGGLVMRLLQGYLFGMVLVAGDDVGPTARPIVSTLLLVLGLLLLTKGYMAWSKQEDPDEPPPKWLTAMGTLSPLQAFGVGAGLTLVAVKQWVFTLSAIGTISQAAPGLPTAQLLFLFYTLGSLALLIALILVAAIAPGPSSRLLPALRGWMERNNRPLVMAVSLLFGTFFLWKGVTGLLG